MSFVPTPDQADLFKVLNHWVARQPDALLYSFLDARGEVREQLTYQQFANKVEACSHSLQHSFLQRGQMATRGGRVLLAHQPGLDLIVALFACNKAGLIGVPVPPLTASGYQAWLYRVDRIHSDCQPIGLLACTSTLSLLDSLSGTESDNTTAFLQDLISPLAEINSQAMPPFAGGLKMASLPRTAPYEIFFIQYTSGSTSDPKGVMVSHANLLANAAAVVNHAKPVAVSWLPQQHDMGLIGYYIDTMLSGGCTYGMAPASFMKRPLLWLQAISRYRATATSVPSFALELCLHDRRVPKASLQALDLSSLCYLMVAAEPVRPGIFRAFQEKFRVCGLRTASLFVAYGLAEFTLAVTAFGRRHLQLDSAALSRGKVVETTPSPAPTAMIGPAVTELMSCGEALDDTDIRIVDPLNIRLLADGQIGEVWLRGSSKAQGYWQQAHANREIFNALLAGNHYLRTGDIGFMQQRELFICGRLKDMLIVNGRNLYPEDIEWQLQQASTKIRRHGVVAFQVHEGGGIVIGAELNRKQEQPDTISLLQNIRDTLQVPVVKLVYLPAGTLPRTGSGKIRRHEVRELYAQGALAVIPDAAPARDFAELQELKQRYQLTGNEDYTVFDAGIDSLDLAILIQLIKDQLDGSGESVLVQRIDSRLLGMLSIHQLFQFIEGLQQSPRQATQHLTQWLDQIYPEKLAAEQQQMLADRIYQPIRDNLNQNPERIATQNSVSQILLTGATGFLGSFLLAELLLQTDSIICVLVRARNTQHAQQRLQQQFFATHGQTAQITDFLSRVKVICGDLCKAQLGMSEQQWEKLTRSIDTIYHNGAEVNYVLDYQRLHGSNVTGTRQILDMAFSGIPKELNYISTTFVFGWATKAVLSEEDQNIGMDKLDFGYSQSKWVAEQLVLSAQQQGLPVRLFRPALITPALDGRGGSLDITTRLLAFMIKYGLGVDTQNQVSFTPVELTAKNIVSIARQPDSLGSTFHVTRDRHETLRQVTQLISQKTGMPFTHLALADFVPAVVSRCTVDDPLYPLLDFLVGSEDNIAAMEFKRYCNKQYRQSRDQFASGQQDASLDAVVDGIIIFLRNKDLLPCG